MPCLCEWGPRQKRVKCNGLFKLLPGSAIPSRFLSPIACSILACHEQRYHLVHMNWNFIRQWQSDIVIVSFYWVKARCLKPQPTDYGNLALRRAGSSCSLPASGEKHKSHLPLSAGHFHHGNRKRSVPKLFSFLIVGKMMGSVPTGCLGHSCQTTISIHSLFLLTTGAI